MVLLTTTCWCFKTKKKIIKIFWNIPHPWYYHDFIRKIWTMKLLAVHHVGTSWHCSNGLFSQQFTWCSMFPHVVLVTTSTTSNTITWWAWVLHLPSHISWCSTYVKISTVRGQKYLGSFDMKLCRINNAVQNSITRWILSLSLVFDMGLSMD